MLEVHFVESFEVEFVVVERFRAVKILVEVVGGCGFGFGVGLGFEFGEVYGLGGGFAKREGADGVHERLTWDELLHLHEERAVGHVVESEKQTLPFVVD